VSTGIIVFIIAALAIAIMAVVGRAEYNKRKLRRSFGPEYDRVVREHGNLRAVDRELLRRKRLHDSLSLQTISAQDQEFYTTSWQHLQGGFLDDPVLALGSAEQLVAKLLDARGYPSADQNEQLSLLSVKHAKMLADYREAQLTSRRAQMDPASTSTEDIRKALLHCRALFDGVLAAPGAVAAR
jgi:hypothetical protein